MNQPRYHFIIYLIWNKDNGMIYVGQHRTFNPNDSYMGSGTALTKVYQDYKRQGLTISEHFEKIILYDFPTFEEMNDMERQLVDIEFVSNPWTYNRVLGGGSGKDHGGLTITYNNSTYTLTQWSEILGIERATIKARIYAGWTIKDIIEKPADPRSVLYEYDGEFRTLREWSEIKHIPYMTLRNRIKRLGWNIRDAINDKSYSRKKFYSYNGKTMALKDWSKQLNISLNTLCHRLYKLNWPIDKALSTELL